MNFRELLRYQIWSKETTRKILAGFGIFFGVVLLLGLIEFCFITPKERMLGSSALAQIDLLRKLSPESAEFEVESKNADEKVEKAAGAAITIRDKHLAFALNALKSDVELRREIAKERRQMEDWRMTHPNQGSADKEFEQETDLRTDQADTSMSVMLHSLLD